MQLQVYDKGKDVGVVNLEPGHPETALMELIAIELPDGQPSTVFHIFGMDYGIVIHDQNIVEGIYAALEDVDIHEKGFYKDEIGVIFDGDELIKEPTGIDPDAEYHKTRSHNAAKALERGLRSTLKPIG